jgi:ADP-ribose pyrophosphatase YjhB (NUDIX family)
MPSAAAALIFDNADHILLIREGSGRKRYGLPGGVIESGESPRTATVREAHEELGLLVDPTELVAVYHLRTDRGEGMRYFFRCDILEGEPTVGDTGEIAGFVWAETDRLPSPLTTTAPYAIADATAGRVGVYREIDARGAASG